MDEEPDAEWAEYQAWVDREVAAGRGPEPEIWEPDPPGGWSWEEPVPPRFGQREEADVLPPGPRLVALTERAVGELARLTDNELVGVLQAARRQAVREQYKQTLAIAEFARRREAASEAALARGVPVRCAAGGFPGDELAMELVTTRADAGHRIDDALGLVTRLPRTLAGMAAGLIDETRAGWIAFYTRSLSDADAARADEALAADAPDLRADQLARKAAALEKKLAPDAVEQRKTRQRQVAQRVEARRELSGNASLSGREMDTGNVMASKAYIDALALKLRQAGFPGGLGALRVLVLADLTQGRDPLARLGSEDPANAGRPAPEDAAVTDWPGWGAGDEDDEWDNGGDSEGGGDDGDSPGAAEDSPGGGAAFRSKPAPIPAQVNLTIPIGTLLGWSTAPAEAGTWGLLGAGETREIAAASARHPATRWCLTLTGSDGTALAHACGHGPRPDLLDGLTSPSPPPERLAELIRRIGRPFRPILTGSCDITGGCDGAESRYTPSRALKHLVRARTSTCDAPGCGAQAVYCDLDHTVPWPQGATCQCNLGPRCRTHHRAKQAPDWTVEQSAPGVTRWTLPSGRTHTTTPTKYDS
jgi:hypothetical protein